MGIISRHYQLPTSNQIAHTVHVTYLEQHMNSFQQYIFGNNKSDCRMKMQIRLDLFTFAMATYNHCVFQMWATQEQCTETAEMKMRVKQCDHKNISLLKFVFALSHNQFGFSSSVEVSNTTLH